tara:strand:+ start:13646 stop:14353 length:708 start_codon:yes stop_codon:yes gene_type:complete
MKLYKHLFFDMDMTIAPSGQPIFPEMYNLLDSLPHDITVVSGQTVENISWQSNRLPARYLGQNGNHATDLDDTELWYLALDDRHKREIRDHIDVLIKLLGPDYVLPPEELAPIEDRGGQITFSPVGNTAPVETKRVFDPDRKKRESLLEKHPFISDELVVKIGGSTGLDYIHKDRHKGTNVQRLIDHMDWNKDECVYFGDGLYPGGNDEAVIGVIETIAVDDHEDTYRKLKEMFS